MNWFQKLSSVTFYLRGSHKIAQPKDINRLGHDLKAWAYENAPRSIIYDIMADGYEEGPTGTINWYVPKESANDVADVRMYIQQWYQEELAPLGFKIRIHDKPEVSKMFNIPVWRVDILSNPTVEREKIPSLNIANTNAMAVFSLLGLPFEPDGSLDLRVVLGRLDEITQETRENHVGVWKDETVGMEIPEEYRVLGPSQVGLDQIDRYVTELYKIVHFGLQNGFDRLEWS